MIAEMNWPSAFSSACAYASLAFIAWLVLGKDDE